jgi:hypothetical protein
MRGVSAPRDFSTAIMEQIDHRPWRIPEATTGAGARKHCQTISSTCSQRNWNGSQTSHEVRNTVSSAAAKRFQLSTSLPNSWARRCLTSSPDRAVCGCPPRLRSCARFRAGSSARPRPGVRRPRVGCRRLTARRAARLAGRHWWRTAVGVGCARGQQSERNRP